MGSRPHPLFGLDRLATRPDVPVLIAEGCKAADAAAQHFPDFVAISWPGGTNSVQLADWSALANRHVTIWPDNDVSGKKAAAQIASFLRDAGAASVAIVDLPEGLPDGWDLADPIPDGVDIEALVQEAGADRAAEADLTAVLPAGYSTTRSGLTWTDPSDDEKPPILLCGPIEIMAETRDGDGASWGGRHELEIQRGPSS